jgi:lauroyl/myristoyl acyltransferase
MLNIEDFKKIVDNPSNGNIRKTSYGFALFQANMNRFMPEIEASTYEKIFKQLIINQHIATLGQDDFEIIDNINVHNNSFISLNGKMPTEYSVIFATFHYGHYRMLLSYLAKIGYKIVLIVDDFVFDKKSSAYYKSFDRIIQHYKQTDSDLIVLNVKESSTIFKIKNLMNKGYALVVFLDGNTGLLKKPNYDKGFIEIDFLKSKIYAKIGVGILSYLLKAQIIPALTYWDEMQMLHLDFMQNLEVPNLRRENYTIFVIKKLYSILETYIKREPEQWECWSYMHKWINRTEIFQYFTENKIFNNMFNNHRYTTFTVKENAFIFDKFSYLSYPIGNETFEHINNNRLSAIPVGLYNEFVNKNIII